MAKAKEKVVTASTVAGVLGEFEKQGFNFGYKPKESKFFSTSNVGVDWALTGGWLVGKILEIYGKTGSGKTTAAIQTAVGVQQSGGVIVWADYERAFDAEYATALGLDIYAESFIFLRPESLEKGGDQIVALVKTGEIDLVVIDSIARMTTESELNGSLSDVTVADKAKALYKFCRMVLNPLDDNDTSLLFINHVLEAINTMNPGAPAQKITPGGNAVPFFASQRVECTRISSIKDADVDAKYAGYDIQFTVVKNRAGVPFRQIVVRNDFGTGFNNTRSALEVANDLGIVERNGGWIKIVDPELVKLLNKEQVQGWDNFVYLVANNPEALGRLVSAAIESLQGAPNVTD